MERSLLLLIICSTFLFAQDSFYYWARITTQNSIVTHEEFFVSPVMNKEELPQHKATLLCNLNLKKDKNQTTFYYLDSIKSNLLECFLSQSVKVYAVDDYKTRLANTKTHIIIYPTLFTVKFTKDSTRIYALSK